MERYRSGQTGQTVNLLAIAFVGSTPTLSTIYSPVAQLAEQAAVNRLVVGSSPTRGAILGGGSSIG